MKKIESKENDVKNGLVKLIRGFKMMEEEQKFTYQGFMRMSTV